MHWLLALPVLAFGLALHGLNLAVAFAFIRDCLQRGWFKRRSGLPILGPLLITLGWWLSPVHGQAWIVGLPWGLDLLAFLSSYLVLRATKAKPA